MLKQQRFKISGMNRDNSVSISNPESSYENKNIRLVPTNNNTLLDIVNEKGTKLVDIRSIDFDNNDNIEGLPIGTAVIDDKIVLFTTTDPRMNNVPDITSESKVLNINRSEEHIEDILHGSEDTIYLLDPSNDVVYKKKLFNGRLGFSYKNPIETLVVNETNLSKKVYWIDGINQLRVINVAEKNKSKWTNKSFDFIHIIDSNITLDVEKLEDGSGTFEAGVIQYVATYTNRFLQETNIVGESPLMYISNVNRGGSPEDKISTAFNVKLNDIDLSFDCVKIYSIHRTSIDATPTVKLVATLSTASDKNHFETDSITKKCKEKDVLVFDRQLNKILKLSEITPTFQSNLIRSFDISSSKYKYVKLPVSDYIYIDNNKTIRLLSSGISVSASYKDGSPLSITRKGITYTDNGESGSIEDPTKLLYIGGEPIVAQTMTQKDNTLFLGNLSLLRPYLSENIKNKIHKLDVKFSLSKLRDIKTPEGYYYYENQLNKSSFDIKTFKYLETYRLGLQFQHNTGKWSDPVWVGDFRNNKHIIGEYTKGNTLQIPVASCLLNDPGLINSIVSLGYIKARPVIVYPTISDRECICQGILCPTVYNVRDRYSNTPFAQSSWFIRPNAPFDIATSKNDWEDRNNESLAFSENSKAGSISNNNETTSSGAKMEIVNTGSFSEFRHNKPIPSNENRNAEIQCIYNPPESPCVTDGSESSTSQWVSDNSENYYIDQSILTLHSPDIEFSDEIANLNSANLKLRIIGIVPLTGFATDIDIQTSTPQLTYTDSDIITPGFYKEFVGAENVSRMGWKNLNSGVFWLDDVSKPRIKNPYKYPTGFVIYPFHRNGSLNNCKNAEDGYRPSMLNKKKLSNLRYSFNSYFFDEDKIWEPSNGISGITVFNQNEVVLNKIPAPLNSGLSSINYYGNVDTTVSISRVGDKEEGYPIIATSTEKSTIPDTSMGITDIFPVVGSKDFHKVFTGEYKQVDSGITEWVTGTDPVRIKYKSTPHIALALNYTTNKEQVILPTLFDGNSSGSSKIIINNSEEYFSPLNKLFWEKKKTTIGVHQDVIDCSFSSINNDVNSYSPSYGFLWLAELYNDSHYNRFGGDTKEALENNLWLPCGYQISLLGEDNLAKKDVTIEWLEGDTYYQRYDNLKTYPFTLEDQNSVVDIASFMCETRVNIDGRYDRNRGMITNLAVLPANFNLINEVYSQKNNFFNFRIPDESLITSKFPNTITWTKTKTFGEDVDTWTNITLASTLDVNTNNSGITSLNKYNNDIIIFQDKNISLLLFNSRTQIATNEGLPVELANSGKLDGTTIISTENGCVNKWSIVESDDGVFFVDDLSKRIMLLGNGITSLSDTKGFRSWINNQSRSSDWNPVDFDGIISYYDKHNGDILFITKDECLAFSKELNRFSSFYSYNNAPYFITVKDKEYWINTSQNKEDSPYKLWEHNKGDYNMYFERYQPHYVTIIVNPDGGSDKIFNTVEFRADAWDSDNLLSNETFDTLSVWNEYQSGQSSLKFKHGIPSNLKKKFRIWRANIPRASINGRDRMRNPWLYVKLSKDEENTYKNVLHDLIVHYFD